MSLDLYERLRRLKERAEEQRPVTAGPVPARVARDLAGWEQVAPLVYRRMTELPLPVKAGARSGEGETAQLLSRSVLLSGLPEERGAVELSRLGFYDLETTGLSGGAGSYIFLFGLGRVTGQTFTVEQLLLGDYPAEPDFISRIVSLLAEFGLLVSYNGRAFDSHLLSTRFLMNGVKAVLPAQLDLLYPSRSLYRSRIGSCSLSDIERDVLRIERSLDVPGFLIPGIYFDFLRGADAATLEPVAAHHLEDIVSLFRLLLQIEGDLAADPGGGTIDCYQAARLLLRRGFAERARGLLEVCIEASSAGLQAVLLLARIYLRSGEVSTCEALWRREFDRSGSVRAGIELAKVLEHRRRSYGEALGIVDRMLDYPEKRIAAWKEALYHRRSRLRRRTGGSGAN